MSNLLESEIKWINCNSGRYDSEMHKNAVIENIKKRYKINTLKNLLKEIDSFDREHFEKTGFWILLNGAREKIQDAVM